MITVDGRAVLVVRVDASADDERVAATKSTLLREATGRVMFVDSGPADVHIAVSPAELRVDAVGIQERRDLGQDVDDTAIIEQTVSLVARRLNQHFAPAAS